MVLGTTILLSVPWHMMLQSRWVPLRRNGNRELHAPRRTHGLRERTVSLPPPAPQAETLVGVMSDKALDTLINSKGKFNMSSNW